MKIKLDSHWRSPTHYLAPGEYEADDLPASVVAHLVETGQCTVLEHSPAAVVAKAVKLPKSPKAKSPKAKLPKTKPLQPLPPNWDGSLPDDFDK